MEELAVKLKLTRKSAGGLVALVAILVVYTGDAFFKGFIEQPIVVIPLFLVFAVGFVLSEMP